MLTNNLKTTHCLMSCVERTHASTLLAACLPHCVSLAQDSLRHHMLLCSEPGTPHASTFPCTKWVVATPRLTWLICFQPKVLFIVSPKLPLIAPSRANPVHTRLTAQLSCRPARSRRVSQLGLAVALAACGGWHACAKQRLFSSGPSGVQHSCAAAGGRPAGHHPQQHTHACSACAHRTACGDVLGNSNTHATLQGVTNVLVWWFGCRNASALFVKHASCLTCDTRPCQRGCTRNHT